MPPKRHLIPSSSSAPKSKEARLWGGRFKKSDTESISSDKALYKHNILSSMAHASMLAKKGLITKEDRDSIDDGLTEIAMRIESGEFEWRTDMEDVHMNIEAALTDMIGETAEKLMGKIKHMQVSLVELAMRNGGVIVPGYTHLQRVLCFGSLMQSGP